MFDRAPWTLGLSPAPPSPPGAAPRIELAVQRLHRAIVSCELAPGAIAHESALVERFRLGRAAVRVALTRLESTGLVVRQARQGWRVAPLDGVHVTALIAARRQIEPSLARRSLSADEARQLRPLVAAVSAAAGQWEPAILATARAAERRIRDLLAETSGPLARRWFAEIADHSSRIVRALEIAGQKVSPADLGPLVEALASSDSIAAEAIIRSEIDGFEIAVARAMLAMPAAEKAAIRRPRRRSHRPAEAAAAPALERKD